MKERTMMRNEITRRLESSTWDYFMAESVTKRINQMKERRLMTSAAASLAMAAMATIIFLFDLSTSYTMNSSDILASKNSLSEELYDPSKDVLIAEIDIMINEAYPMR